MPGALPPISGGERAAGLNPTMSTLRRHLLELCVATLLLVAAALSPRLMPHNMDEFSAYQLLGCLHSPLSLEYNDFDLGCRSFDLKLPGTDTWLPLRAYTYLGAGQSLLFWPLWKLVHAPVAGRILGAVCLLLASLAIARLVRVRWRYALLASVLLPVYALAYPEETGSAALPVVSVLAVMLLLRAAMNAPSGAAQLSLGVATGLAALFGIQMKPVFLWTAPALVLWALWLWRERSGTALPRWSALPWRPLLAAALGLLLPLAWLLMAIDRDGHRFYQVASSGGLTLSPRTILNSVYWLGMLVTDSALFNKRVLSIPDSLLLDFVPCALSLLLLGLAWLRGSPAQRARLLLFLAQAGVTFLVICTNASAWAPHHLVFALLFLVMALAEAIAQLAARPPARWPLAAGLVCALYWATLVVRLPQAYIHRDTGFDKDRMVSWMLASGLDRDTVQLHSDWGTYYLAHVFGDERALVTTQLLYWHPRAEQRRDLERIRALAQRLGRDVLLVCMEATGTRDDPLVRETLGEPVQVYRFDTWSITRFRPAR